MRASLSFRILTLLAATGFACSDSPLESNSGPWLGDWVQVNFLALDDNGVWDEDDLTGIGFVQSISETEWRLTDEFGSGCTVTFAYTIRGGDRFERDAVSAGDRCPPGFPIGLLNDSGRLEFSANGNVMIEWYDLQPGDEIAAFRWVRR